ncbi:hypothetical protein L2E82_27890 [Cichorium intybus]|uniref:Uncharacterized protein n=1 Tax=Cichorium intybus TaxID=13427 RepID=A0ACB9CUE3_CICIN|nr:hypothetical protein L2E82_27890 [Cichorium intybus]
MVKNAPSSILSWLLGSIVLVGLCCISFFVLDKKYKSVKLNVALSYTFPNRLLSCVLSMNTRFGTPFTLNRLQHYCKPPTELLPLDSAITIHSPPPQHSSQPSEATTHQSYCSPQHYISSSCEHK